MGQCLVRWREVASARRSLSLSLSLSRSLALSLSLSHTHTHTHIHTNTHTRTSRRVRYSRMLRGHTWARVGHTCTRVEHTCRDRLEDDLDYCVIEPRSSLFFAGHGPQMLRFYLSIKSCRQTDAFLFCVMGPNRCVFVYPGAWDQDEWLQLFGLN